MLIDLPLSAPGSDCYCRSKTLPLVLTNHLTMLFSNDFPKFHQCLTLKHDAALVSTLPRGGPPASAASARFHPGTGASPG